MTFEELAAWLDDNGASVEAIREATKTTRLVKDEDVGRNRSAVIAAYIMPYMSDVEAEELTPRLMASAVTDLTFAALTLDRVTVTRYTSSQATHEASNSADRSVLSDLISVYRKRGVMSFTEQLGLLGKKLSDASFRRILLDEL